MITTSPENFRITRDNGFTVQGMKNRQRRKAQRMEPGDRIVYYITGLQRFGGTCTVTSECFEDHEPVWASEGKPDDYPWRVNIKPTAVLEEELSLDAREIGPRLEYVKRWPPESWPLAFQGNLHILPRNDFDLLEQEIQKVFATKAEAARRPS